MSELITDEKSGYFRLRKFRNDRRVVVFTICVLISSILWFLNALGKYYETTLNYPVNYINFPEGMFLANTPPKTLELIVEAHGFTLLQNKMNLRFTPVELDVQRMLANAEKPDSRTYKIVTAGLVNRLSDQISSEIKIIEIRPLSFILSLDGLDTKNVKVAADLDLEFLPQYNLSSEIQIVPEYAGVTGPLALLDSVESVSTEHYKIEKIGKSTEVVVKLAGREKLDITPSTVKVIIPVEEFTEKVIAVPVSITGQPENTSIKLFPSEVQVSFKVGLSKYSEVTADNFHLTIPYSEMAPGIQNVAVQIAKKPGFVYDIKCTPQAIEFLIEKQ